jgi:microcompartment protein CcmL/EutN
MTVRSLGLIETWGLVAAIEAADAGVKAANVCLKGYDLARGGLVTVRFEGDVAAVRAAVSAASVAAGKVGRVVSTHVIARPHVQVQRVYGDQLKQASLSSEPRFGVPTEAAAGGDASDPLAEAKGAEPPFEPVTAIFPAESDPVPPPAEEPPEDVSIADPAGDMPAVSAPPEVAPPGEREVTPAADLPPVPPVAPVVTRPVPQRRRTGGRKPGGGEPKKK